MLGISGGLFICIFITSIAWCFKVLQSNLEINLFVFTGHGKYA